MKLTHKNILACALAAGLMTGAGKVKAAVIDNTLFTPVTIQIVAFTTPNDNGKIVKVRINNKDLLTVLSDTFNESFKNDQLAVEIGNSDSGDVVIINKNGVVEDLSSGDDINIDLNDVVDSNTENSKQAKHSEAGDATFTFYSDPQFDDIEDTELDTAESENASSLWFELTGSYHYTETDTFKNNSSKVKRDTSFKAFFNGEGFDADVNGFDEDGGVPVSGSVVGSGSGTITEVI
jgi:hypothetical protein